MVERPWESVLGECVGRVWKECSLTKILLEIRVRKEGFVLGE